MILQLLVWAFSLILTQPCETRLSTMIDSRRFAKVLCKLYVCQPSSVWRQICRQQGWRCRSPPGFSRRCRRTRVFRSQSVPTSPWVFYSVKHAILYRNCRYACVSVCKFLIVGQTARPIGTKLGTRIPDGGTVLGMSRSRSRSERHRREEAVCVRTP